MNKQQIKGFKRFIAELDEDGEEIQKIANLVITRISNCPEAYKLQDFCRNDNERDCIRCWEKSLEDKANG